MRFSDSNSAHRFLILYFIVPLLGVSLSDELASQTVQTNVPALKDVYANDFRIGCLLSYAHIGFADDPYVPGASSPISPNGGTLIKFHMNSMGPGNNMKPQYTVDIAGSASAYSVAVDSAARDSVDVHPIVRFNGNLFAQLGWAQRQGFTFRGHTLVWHNQTPGTAFFRSGYSDVGARLSKERMSERMGNYIKEVIRLLHETWPGLLTAMDVVNEAVNDDGSNRTTNEWYTTFGDMSFIAKAFEFTRQHSVAYGETQMKLYYNDYNTHVPSKANAIVNVVRPIFLAGNLDGIGMQDHDGLAYPTAEQWIASYNKFDTVCSEISVTELDVNPGTVNTQTLASQANQFAALFKCFLDRSARSGRGKLVSVTKDGLNDQYTFVANSSLWDNQYQCKPSFYAVVEVGTSYHALDSLIAVAGTLDSSDYTLSSWSEFADSLNLAVSAMEQNYSQSVSAATALTNAAVTLSTAFGLLVPTGVAETHASPERFSVGQNYPNPFNPRTTVPYSVARSGRITLKVYNLLGVEVATLYDGLREPGEYQAVFHPAGLSSGTYLYQLAADGFVESRRLVLLK